MVCHLGVLADFILRYPVWVDRRMDIGGDKYEIEINTNQIPHGELEIRLEIVANVRQCQTLSHLKSILYLHVFN